MLSVLMHLHLKGRAVRGQHYVPWDGLWLPVNSGVELPLSAYRPRPVHAPPLTLTPCPTAAVAIDKTRPQTSEVSGGWAWWRYAGLLSYKGGP